MSKVTIMDHPLIHHKISILRNVETGSKQFRELVDEIAMLMAFEATRDLPMHEVEIETPIQKAKVKMLAGKKLAIVPILRAGLGMVNGILALVPSAKIGHIGMYRDHDTLEPKPYFCKLPEDISERLAIVLDPMLATGGSASEAIFELKRKGVKQIKMMSILAAPEGIEKIKKDHPDIELYVGVQDEKLNEVGYIVPGLGDAGDRLFGTL